MSEFTGTRCDGCGLLTDQLPQRLEGWEEDDMGGHACPECQAKARELEEGAASGEDLAVFGETLAATADAVLESPEVVKLKADRKAAYEKIKKDTFKAIRKEMKANHQSEEAIKDALDDIEKELDDTYNQKFNFKAEA